MEGDRQGITNRLARQWKGDTGRATQFEPASEVGAVLRRNPRLGAHSGTANFGVQPNASSSRRGSGYSGASPYPGWVALALEQDRLEAEADLGWRQMRSLDWIVPGSGISFDKALGSFWHD